MCMGRNVASQVQHYRYAATVHTHLNLHYRRCFFHLNTSCKSPINSDDVSSCQSFRSRDRTDHEVIRRPWFEASSASAIMLLTLQRSALLADTWVCMHKLSSKMHIAWSQSRGVGNVWSSRSESRRRYSLAANRCFHGSTSPLSYCI